MAAADGGAPAPRLPENPTPEQLDGFFKDDTFAYQQAGCRVVEAWRGHGVAEMEISPEKHLNAQGRVMGGAVFTLADYAFAAASLCGEASSVSLTSTIEFMSSPKGNKLIATCDVDRTGRKVGFYTIDVADDLGGKVARVVTTCYRPA